MEDLDGPEAKQILGERLYPLIEVEQGSLAGKITGMLLHGLDNSELVALIDDQATLQFKIQEALAVLEAYHQTKVAPMVPAAVARTVQRAPLSRSQLEQSKLPPSPLRCATASSDLSTATTATASSDFSAPPQLMKRPYATPPPLPPLHDGDHMSMMSGGPLVTAEIEAGGKPFHSCQQLTRSGTPLWQTRSGTPLCPPMTPTMELEEIKTWTATQKPSPSLITRMDIGRSSMGGALLALFRINRDAVNNIGVSFERDSNGVHVARSLFPG